MNKLPVVTQDTFASVTQSFYDDKEGNPLLVWLKEMGDENPVVALHIAEWIKCLPSGISDTERNTIAMGPILIYQLLKAQLASDNVKMP